MAELSETAQAWTRAWLDMQKQYLDAWSQFPRPPLPWNAAQSPFATAGGAPWAEAFAQWSKLFSAGLPQDARAISDRLFELGKSYVGMSESFWKLLQQEKQATLCAADWQEALKSSIEQSGKAFNFPANAGDPWTGFATLWGLPLSNWQRMACSFSPFPGEMEKALRTDRMPEPGEMTRALRSSLSLPAIGYTREWQEQLQEWTELNTEYSHALQNFSLLLGKVVQRALELFGQRMTQRLKAGESLDGLRAVYDLWIDCGEDAYAEQVATSDFPHLQAELVNALMRMKRHEQLMVEEAMTALNIPTRREMDTSHKRVYEMQRQVRALQDALEEAAEPEAAATQPAPKSAHPVRKKAPARKAASATRRRTQPRTKKG